MAGPVTLVLVAVPPNIRHALTRWMIEPAPGVFIGTVSAKVRDELWSLIENETHGGWAVLIHTAQNEQGFAIRSAGSERRTIVDCDGIALVTTSVERSQLENKKNESRNSW